MAFTIDESFLPATLTAQPMTDKQFIEFCAEHPDLRFEMTAEGEIIVMALSSILSGARNSNICSQLYAWAQEDGRGAVTAAAAGFLLPNGARRSADAAWTDKAKFQQLTKKQLETFWQFCPAFVIELKSETDLIRSLGEKMREWITNGSQLAWLIDPDKQTIEIYRPNREPETVSGVKSLAAESPVDGFVLDLKRIWDPLGD
jgi:Uma2 family endonuclease